MDGGNDLAHTLKVNPDREPWVLKCEPVRNPFPNENNLLTSARDDWDDGDGSAPDLAGDCVAARRSGFCEGERGRSRLHRQAVRVRIYSGNPPEGSGRLGGFTAAS